MKRFTIAAAVIAIISGVLLKGTFGHWLIVMAAGIYLGAPLAVFLGIWLIIGLKRDSTISTGLKKTFFTWDRDSHPPPGDPRSPELCCDDGSEARSIQEGARTVSSDTFRHRSIPPPKLLNDAHSYTAESNSFRFEYWNAAGMMDGYYFDSTTRKWNYFD